MDPATLLVALAALLAAAVVARLASQTVLRGTKPPVYEGVPFVGGLLAFARVSGERARQEKGERGERGAGRRGGVQMRAPADGRSADGGGRPPRLLFVPCPACVCGAEAGLLWTCRLAQAGRQDRGARARPPTAGQRSGASKAPCDGAPPFFQPPPPPHPTLPPRAPWPS